MTQAEFKKLKLVFSFSAENIEKAKELISEKVYYGSKINFTMFETGKGYEYFYFVNFKGEINYTTILCRKENKYQLRFKI